MTRALILRARKGGPWLRVSGLGFGASGPGCRVWGSGVRVHGSTTGPSAALRSLWWPTLPPTPTAPLEIDPSALYQVQRGALGWRALGCRYRAESGLEQGKACVGVALAEGDVAYTEGVAPVLCPLTVEDLLDVRIGRDLHPADWPATFKTAGRQTSSILAFVDWSNSLLQNHPGFLAFS